MKIEQLSTSKDEDISQLEMLARCDTIYGFMPKDLNQDRYLGDVGETQRDFDTVE
jgi:hypothetical protein